MSSDQAIERPFGVSVFGSAVLRVAPDIAAITCTVSRLERQPADAFKAAHAGAASVSGFLAGARITEVGSSRVTLTATFRNSTGASEFVGYTAAVEFQIVLRDLDRLEEILTGVIGSGANKLGGVSMQTSQLKEYRAEARRRAVAAAREKADNYCLAAGVKLGPVIHIEDVNPDRLTGRFEGHRSMPSPSVDDEDGIRAFDPGEISVAGAVIVAWELGR